MSTKEKFSLLNTLRVAVGMKPLKAWKDSSAKLDTAIEKLKPVVEEKKATVKDDGPSDVVPLSRKFSVERVPTADKATTEGAMSISAIAKELNIGDKVARAKLRRRDDVPRLPGTKWMFSGEHIEAIKAILKEDRRKK